MKNNQRKYIDYANHFAATAKKHIWLGGSFLHGDPTPFSDVDISVLMDIDTLRTFIFGYGDPIYISYTTNPEGIIIVIYEDGVTVDLEVIESIEMADVDFFHLEDIKECKYHRSSIVCREICQRNDVPYQMSRLFHRSLIKFLAGKKEAGVRVANEISVFLNQSASVTEKDYQNGIARLIGQYHSKYPLDTKYFSLCLELIDQIKSQKSARSHRRTGIAALKSYQEFFTRMV